MERGVGRASAVSVPFGGYTGVLSAQASAGKYIEWVKSKAMKIKTKKKWLFMVF